MVVFAQPNPVRRRLSDHQQSHDWLDPAGRDPAGRDPAGRDPVGGDPAGRDPACGDPAGRDPAGRDPAGRDPAGGDPAGRDPAGRDPARRDPAGINPIFKTAVSCSCVSHIFSLVLLGDEFSGFVMLMSTTLFFCAARKSLPDVRGAMPATVCLMSGELCQQQSA